MSRKLLILHDSADFGGHERMLLALLPAVLASSDFSDIVFCVPEQNERLRTALQGFAPRLRTITWPYVKRRAEPYLADLRLGYRRAVRRLVAHERPDTILLVQGRIENLAVPMTTLARGPRLVSYIPMAHRLGTMGRSGVLGDRVRRRLYRRPDHFIVPSASVAEQVHDAGGRSPVTVAHNVVSPPPRTPKADARQQLGLPADKRIALFLGRLDVGQKGLDLLAAAIGRAVAGRLDGWMLLFVGDGPGRALVEAAAATPGADIRLVPWTDRPDLYLSAADILLMPSRFEGLPLVMLEAMHYGVPVLASRIDVAQQYLPAENLADFTTIDLPEALDRLSTAEATDRFAGHATAKLAPITLEAAQASFASALAA